MRIWRSEDEFDLQASVVALGMFDGVHIGHQALIRRARELAEEMNAACVVCTFDRHPLALLYPERAPRQLLSIEEKMEKMEKMGVDGVLLHSFTAEFAAMEAEEYLKKLVASLNVKAVVAGFNYSFGAGGRGNAQMLLREAGRLGYRAEIVDAVCDGEDTVSSTLIRALMDDGKTARAEQLMQIANG